MKTNDARGLIRLLGAALTVGLLVPVSARSETARSLQGNLAAAPASARAISGIAGAKNSEQFYYITVPAGQCRLEVTTTGGSGDCDLYVRLGSKPTTTAYTRRSAGPGNYECVTIVNPAAGRWYIMLRGYSAYSGVTLAGSYSTVRFAAVVAGVNAYRYLPASSQLKYCVSDALSIQRKLAQSGWQVTMLTDSGANKSAIRSAIQSNVARSSRFLFTFAGHGTSANGVTGYICPHDIRSSSVANHISESELDSWLAGAQNTQIGVILDSCFSGSFIGRAAGAGALAGIRYAPLAWATPVPAGTTPVFFRDIGGSKRVVLTACKGSELAGESATYGGGHGWLSYRLLSVLGSSYYDKDKNRWSAIEESYAGLGCLSNQHPQMYDGDTRTDMDIYSF
jgi:hypothetical protein